MSKRKEEYLEYLQSDRWKELKEEAYKIHGRICKQCESKKNLQVHHKRYPKELGTEIPKDDLIILCKKCHRKFHGYSLDLFDDDIIFNDDIFKENIRVPLQIIKTIFKLRVRCQIIQIILLLLSFYEKGIKKIKYQDIHNTLSFTENGLRNYIAKMKQGNIILINKENIALNFDVDSWKTRRLE